MLRLPRFDLLHPSGLEEAVQMLADHGGKARVVAGGTDLLPKMKRRQVVPEVLVSVAGIQVLHELRVSPEGAADIGAAVSLSEALEDARLGKAHKGYAQAVGQVSSPALRNAGTVGGNLCVDTRCNYNDMTEEWRTAIGFCLKTGGDECRVAASSPRCWAVSSSDTAPVAVALAATAVVLGPQGEREIPVASLYRDDGADHLALSPGEILTTLRLPAARGWHAAYVKLRRRASMDFPVASAAVALKLDGPVVEGCRIALGAVASRPLDLSEVAGELVGRKLDDDAISEVSSACGRLAKPLDNTDLSYLWRKRMVAVIVEKALRQAAASS
jgi:4-hydroxybenzoyl-CoA reductase subunit beta